MDAMKFMLYVKAYTNCCPIVYVFFPDVDKILYNGCPQKLIERICVSG